MTVLVEELHEALRAEMHAEMKQLEQRMTMRLGTMMVVAIGVVAVLDGLL